MCSHVYYSSLESADVKEISMVLNSLRLLLVNLSLTFDFMPIFSDMKPLSEALKEMNNLHTLNLSYNTIGDNGMEPLAEALEKVNSLHTLDLSHDEIGDEGIKLLTKALKEINNLHTLDLSYNKIGNNGIKSLTELFEYPRQFLCNLKVLILNDNAYDEDGAKFLAERLKKILQLHTIEFNLDTIAFSAEILSHILQKNLQETPVNLPQQALLDHNAEQSPPYMFSFIVGLVVLIGTLLFLSTRWNLQKLENSALHGNETVITLLDTAY